MPRLVLSRKVNEGIHMELPDGREIIVTVTRNRDYRVRLCIEAPQDVLVNRSELLTREAK